MRIRNLEHKTKVKVAEGESTQQLWTLIEEKYKEER